MPLLENLRRLVPVRRNSGGASAVVERKLDDSRELRLIYND